MRIPFHRRTITSGFGWRRDPITAKKSHHNGVDFGVPGGVAVLAIANGKVRARRTTKAHGNILELEHDDGLVSKYFHLRNPVELKTGSSVTEGQKVAVVGHTGTTARGDHLHLETWVEGTVVDPLSLLE